MSRNRTETDAALARIEAGGRPADFESSTLDFKEDRPSAADTEKLLVEAAVCFANASGGTIVVGVRDKATGPDAFLGTKMVPERVQQRIYELTRPPLNVEVEHHPRFSALLLVTVPQSVEIHADTQGRAYRRINRDCLPMSPQEQAFLREERYGIDHSASPSGHLVSTVSAEAIAAARRMLALFTDERRLLANAEAVDLLNGIGALSSREELNTAGALMFCEPPTRSVVEVLYQYRDTPGGEPRSAQRLFPPLVLAFQQTMGIIEARSSSQRITLSDGQQISIEDFPLVAVRESLSNAFCHRDLRLSEPISIEHSPTVMRITSPGPLMPGITPNNIITTASRPRNPSLARIARHLGLAEELGSGVDRMVRAMIGAGRRPPQIDGEPNRVSVTLVGGAPKTQVARFVAQLPDVERDDTDTMLLLHYLCEHRTVTALTAATWLQRSEVETDNVLRRLAADGANLLERTRATARRASPAYRLRSDVLQGLGSAVAYNRRTIDDIDRKVITHVKEYGKVTNRTLKNMFDIDVYRARDIIADLAQRGILVRVSEAQRGPAVEWGPGPTFPAPRGRKSGG